VEEEAAAQEAAPVETEVAGPNVYDPENKPGILEFDQPFTIKLKKKEGVLQGETYLKFALSLEVKDEETQTAMSEDPVIMARIKDKINTYFASQYPSNVAVSNWTQLKDNLKALINDEFPQDYKIVRINFHDFLIQTGR
jgi:flagellar basal body-associated protein FliL